MSNDDKAVPQSGVPGIDGNTATRQKVEPAGRSPSKTVTSTAGLQCQSTVT